MSPVAAPDAVSAITSRIASIQSQIRSLSPAIGATASVSAPRPAGSSTTATDSSAIFASALSDAAKAAGAPAGFAATRAPALSSAGSLATAPSAGSLAAAPSATSAAASSISALSATPATVTGDDVIASAKKYLGVPYVWGGTTPSGLDCSGLVQLAFKDLGIDLPRVSRDQAKAGDAVASLSDARPGDLVAFGSPVDHIAIYLGGNRILEAPQPGQDVHITEMYRTPTAIRRIVPGGDGTDSGMSGLFAATPAPGSLMGAPGLGAQSLGVPPGLMVAFDPAQLAGVPRAIPLAALAATGAPGSAATARDAVAGALAAGAAQGATADRLTAAGLSDAVAAFAGDFAAAERKFNLPSGLLAAVAQVESGGRTDAVSRAGAQGLMQLMPGTAAGLGVTDPFDPQQAINGAAQYLSSNLAAFGGSLTKALAAYNAGPGAVREYDGIPPYAETQNYVRKVTDMLARLS